MKTKKCKQDSDKRKSQENIKPEDSDSEDANTNIDEFIDNKLDTNVNSDSLPEIVGLYENVGRDHQKQSKRKANPNDLETSEEKPAKIMKNNLTPESLPPITTTTPCTPVPVNHSPDDDSSFLRRLRSYSENPKRKDYFAALPDEVILMMFKHLPKTALISCACVCKRWKRIAYDTNLWPRVELSQRKLTPGSMAHILMRGPQIVRMSQTEVSSPVFHNMEEAMDNFVSKIEYLDLSMATISSKDLESLLRTCHVLQKLSLEDCELNEEICKEIAKNGNLTVLNMSQCSGLNEAGIEVILTNCKKLIELNIAWTSLNSAAIKAVCKFVPKDILKINLSGCLKEINDKHVSTLAIRCNKLKELDLSDATGVGNGTIEAIFNNLKSLEVLSLSRCYNIPPTSYTKLFMMPRIKHLNIFGLFHDTQIESLRKSSDMNVNMLRFSSIARPTVGVRRTSIWGHRVRDW